MFEVDELMVMLFCFVFWMIFGNFFLITFVSPFLYSKFKKKYPRGFLRHSLYFIGLIKMHCYPDFFQRKFIE